MHQLTDSVTRPQLFGVKEETPTPTKKPPVSNNNRARDNNSRRRRLDTKEQKPAATRTLSTKMKKVVDEHNSKEGGPLTMAAIRAANNLVSTEELATSFNEGQAICLIKKATKA